MATTDDDAKRDDPAAPGLPPFPTVTPAGDEELARIERAQRYWQTGRGLRWLRDGVFPGDGDDETGER